MSDASMVGNGISIGALAGTLVGWLPPAAAALTIVWVTMQIVINWGAFTEKVREWFRE